ncbi:MAG TPA: cobalt-precorrin 5A hydrolase [Methanoregulaceae archaeon]|nr:cobalt-precorrin 5A hydrolase [Methanoregulaceae archaeon]
MNDVVISLPRFEASARRIADYLGSDLMIYQDDSFRESFSRYRCLVAVMSMGIAVRNIAPLLVDKWNDPAVVVVSPDLSYAIPLIGGHHGGNDMARKLLGMGIAPVITTATETAGKVAVEVMADAMDLAVLNRDSTRAVNAAILDGEVGVFSAPSPSIVIGGPGISVLLKKGEFSLGIGCRRGISMLQVKEAIHTALADAGIVAEEVMIYATTEKKLHEKGLIEAVRAMNGTLLFLDDATITAHPPASPSRAGKIGLPGVAEPCALAAARKKELVLPKKVYGGVTIAIAR